MGGHPSDFDSFRQGLPFFQKVRVALERVLLTYLGFCERDYFKEFMATLRPNNDVLCYPTLMKMMKEAFERMVDNLKKELGGIGMLIF